VLDGPSPEVALHRGTSPPPSLSRTSGTGKACPPAASCPCSAPRREPPCAEPTSASVSESMAKGDRISPRTKVMAWGGPAAGRVRGDAACGCCPTCWA
jgi:hypothetical protein